MRAEDAKYFNQFSIRLSEFQNFAPELARIAQESGPRAARDWVDKSYPAGAHNALTSDLDVLRKHYAERARQTYLRINTGIARTAMLLSLLGALAVLLAVAGVLLIARSVARPLAAITRVTEIGGRRRYRRRGAVQRAARRDRRAWRARSPCSSAP